MCGSPARLCLRAPAAAAAGLVPSLLHGHAAVLRQPCGAACPGLICAWWPAGHAATASHARLSPLYVQGPVAHIQPERLLGGLQGRCAGGLGSGSSWLRGLSAAWPSAEVWGCCSCQRCLRPLTRCSGWWCLRLWPTGTPGALQPSALVVAAPDLGHSMQLHRQAAVQPPCRSRQSAPKVISGLPGHAEE